MTATSGGLTIHWSRRGGRPPYRGHGFALAAPRLSSSVGRTLNDSTSESEMRIVGIAVAVLALGTEARAQVQPAHFPFSHMLAHAEALLNEPSIAKLPVCVAWLPVDQVVAPFEAWPDWTALTAVPDSALRLLQDQQPRFRALADCEGEPRSLVLGRYFRSARLRDTGEPVALVWMRDIATVADTLAIATIHFTAPGTRGGWLCYAQQQHSAWQKPTCRSHGHTPYQTPAARPDSSNQPDSFPAPPPNDSLKLTGRPAALPRPELRPGRPAA